MRQSDKTPHLDYIEQVFAKEDKILTSMAEKAESLNVAGMHIRSHEGKILQILMKMVGARKVVEIGMLVGYSTLWMARGLPDDGKIWSLEKDKKMVEIGNTFFAESECRDKIKVLEGNALESLESISDQGPFDMVFIDANKAGYPDYLTWAENNIRSGGLVVGDNTLLFGNVYKPGGEIEVGKKQWLAMREFNQRIADNPNFTSILLPTTEGMTIALKC